MVILHQNLLSKPLIWLRLSERSYKHPMKGGHYMTANQIAYWNYVENNRHNIASEKEALRSNRAKEREQHRSNVAQESLTSAANQIRQQSNLINDAHYVRQDSEANRHNLAMEQLSRQSNDLQKLNVALGYATLGNQRAIAEMNTGLGYANLSESTRHDIESENIQNRNVSVGRVNAAANRQNAATRQQEFQLKQTQWLDPWATYTRKYTAQNTRLTGSKIQAETDYTKTNTLKLGIDAGVNVLNSLSNLMGSAARVVTAGKGYLQ